MNKNLEILEFHKILEMLANLSANEITREKVRTIVPCSDLAEARTELEKTNDAFQLSVQFGAPPFHAFQDMRMGLRRAKSGARLSLKDLLEIATVLRQIQSLSDWYDRCSGVESSLDDLFSQLAPVPYLLEKLDRSILSEEEIADAASPALADIRRKIGRSRQKLRDTLDSMMRKQDVQDCLQDSRVTLRDGRFVLPVRAEYRSKIPGLVHDTSATGQTIFIEPIAVVDANNDIRLLELQEAEEIERIIEELCTECGTWADAIIRDHEVCAELNLYFAKARLAEQMHAFPPVLTDDGVIVLKKARHPLIPYKKAVPISFTLGGENKALIITGPNTGGKTVALKTCGLLTLMAMSGMLIPAAEGSQISVFDHVLADIGDTQSIEQNLSTFSSHVRRWVDILQKTTPDTLVLCDELGNGTDPQEGMGLAVAMLEGLANRGALILATTHYPEIKTFAETTPGFLNASMTFDPVTLSPLYRMELGRAGQSCALLIARRLGLPEDVLVRAAEACGSKMLKAVPINAAEKTVKMPSAPPKEEVEPQPVKKPSPGSRFQVGDSVYVHPLHRTGIVAQGANAKGEVVVKVADRKYTVNHRRLSPHLSKEELYPDAENYDLDIVLDSVANRKMKKKMSKHHVEGGVVTLTDEPDAHL